MESAPPSIDVQTNLRMVLDSIERAAQKASRSGSSVRLVAVSKTIGVEHIRQAVGGGAMTLGENKVQEASSKQPLLSELPVEWHLIGSLQKNKANRAAEIFDWLASVRHLER